MAVTDKASGPRVVSPPARPMPCASARAKKPSANASTQAMSTCGNDSDSVHQRGCAPIAARSDRFTAKVFQPMSAAAVSAGKCTPALSVSVVIASNSPAGGSSKAASSPMPSGRSSRARLRARRRSIRSNSGIGG